MVGDHVRYAEKPARLLPDILPEICLSKWYELTESIECLSLILQPLGRDCGINVILVEGRSLFRFVCGKNLHRFLSFHQRWIPLSDTTNCVTHNANLRKQSLSIIDPSFGQLLFAKVSDCIPTEHCRYDNCERARPRS